MSTADSDATGTGLGDGFRPRLTLAGRFVDLVPLEMAHVEALADAGKDPRIWEFMVVGPCTTPDVMRRSVEGLLELQVAGTDLPFTVIEKSSHQPIGMTRFLDIRREDRAVEVGGTWFDPRYWRSPVNTDSKRLMFGYAFDREKVNRVQLQTDVRNARSQKAIERLGAVREGILREHRVLSDGRLRSSVVYSVLRSEWPAVRDRLDRYLSRPWTGDRRPPAS
ncbi:MAG: GNAT family N-acetyltransferase [Thermoplasmata archaeon]|nr:GNAT family N-acetyltransferase [Thermoplasmata archaeon]